VPLVHFTEDALYVVSAREDADGEPVFWLHKHIVSRC
jgi:hypothetical protein